MLPKTIVLGVILLLGVQAQLIDFSVGSIGDLEHNLLKNIWPFSSQMNFDIYTPQFWWKGPNVCVERRESVKDPKAEGGQNREVSSEGRVHPLHASLTLSHCFETPNKYTCITKVNVQGEEKTFTTIHKCCHGFVRSRTSGNCVEQGELKSLLPLVEQLKGSNFKKLLGNLGLDDKLTNENVTIFLPVDEALNKATDEISEMNKIEGSQTEEKPETPTKEVIENHLVPGFADLNDHLNEDLLETENKKGTIRLNFYPTPQGGKLATANCIHITKPNNFASNGIVHVVDKLIHIPRQNVRELVEEHPRLSFLRKVLKVNKLDDLLQENKYISIFAPTDDAFEKLDGETKDKLLNGHPCALSILRHHIIPHTICSAAVIENATVHNIDNEELELERRGEDEIFVGQRVGRLIETDRIGTNGVLHIIDTVVIPNKARPLDEVLTRNKDDKFQSLVEKAGLRQELDLMRNVTLFVPFNEAFEEPEAAKYLEDIQNDQNKLRELVLYHAAKGKLESCDMDKNVQLESLAEGKRLSLKSNPLFTPLLFKSRSQPLVQCASLTATEDKSCGSVVHEIDRVLIPPSKTLWELVESEPRLSKFRDLLEGSELKEKLKDPKQHLTLLAPTNYVFGRHKYNMDTLKQDKNRLSVILKRHIIERPFCCQEIKSGDHVFYNFASLADSLQPISPRLIKECDTMAINGILHTANDLLVQED